MDGRARHSGLAIDFDRDLMCQPAISESVGERPPSKYYFRGRSAFLARTGPAFLVALKSVALVPLPVLSSARLFRGVAVLLSTLPLPFSGQGAAGRCGAAGRRAACPRPRHTNIKAPLSLASRPPLSVPYLNVNACRDAAGSHLVAPGRSAGVVGSARPQRSRICVSWRSAVAPWGRGGGRNVRSRRECKSWCERRCCALLALRPLAYPLVEEGTPWRATRRGTAGPVEGSARLGEAR